MANKSSGASVPSNRVLPEKDASGGDHSTVGGSTAPNEEPSVSAAATSTMPPSAAAPAAVRPPSPVRSRSNGGSNRNNGVQQKVFDSVRSAPDPPMAAVGPPADLSSKLASDGHGRRWKLLGKLAMLVRTADPVIEIYHETVAKDGPSRFMLHPNSKLRRIWEVSTALCVVYVVTLVPLILGFNYVDWTVLSGLNTFIDWYFVFDMVMTLRTGVVLNGEVIMDARTVAQRYLHSWFIVDLMSNFPLALFVSSSGKSIKIVKLQKIPKLLRVRRLLKYLREYAKYYNLTISFLALVFGLHLFACIWASLFNECFGPGDIQNCDDSDFGSMYMQSIHTVMLMFLGIGESTSYARIARLRDPATDATTELYAASLAVFLVGNVFASFLFGNVLALLMSWDQQKAQFRNRMDIISAEMKYYELPEDLQHRVRRNYDYLWINQRAYSDMMLLNQPGISKPLRTTIALHLYKDLVKTVPFFAGSDARFLGKVCLALETAVYLPGDTIIYYDEIGKEMFIVRKGLVEILVSDGSGGTNGAEEKRIYLRDGNFFGETALVIDVRRTNTVRAVTICDLNVLSKRAFNEIAAEYPEFGERMKRTVIKRQLDNMNIQSPAEKIKVQNQLSMVVEKSLKQRRMSVSLRTIYRAKKLGDKLKEIADRAAKVNVHSVRRLSRGFSGFVRPGRIGLAARGSSQRSDLLDNSGVFGNAVGGNVPSALSTVDNYGAAGRGRSPSVNRHTFTGVGDSGGLPGARRVDKVSRKLSKAELTLDLIPSALAEISAMVTQIRRTTDRLSRKLDDRSDSDQAEDDELDDDPDDDLASAMGDSLAPFGNYNGDLSIGGDSLPPISPLTEESEEEAARRESNSIFVPHFGDRKQSHIASSPLGKLKS